MNYQKAYYILFNAMTDAINTMTDGNPILTLELRRAISTLKAAQRKTEDMYIESRSDSDEVDAEE